jgi:hypothetical protein
MEGSKQETEVVEFLESRTLYRGEGRGDPSAGPSSSHWSYGAAARPASPLIPSPIPTPSHRREVERAGVDGSLLTSSIPMRWDSYLDLGETLMSAGLR